MGAIIIPLNSGFQTLISPEDAERVREVKWFASSPNPGKYYAMRAVVRGKSLYLHRFIIGAGKGEIVDHINGDGLDNRRENLRIADGTLNNANRSRGPKPASGFRGVYRHHNSWRAEVAAYGKRYRASGFAEPAEAARVYDKMARQHFGDFAVLNFPAEVQ